MHYPWSPEPSAQPPEGAAASTLGSFAAGEQSHAFPSRLILSSKFISQAASATTILVGCVVFVGWMFDIPTLKSIVPVWVTMKANTATGFILAGVSLWLLLTEQADQRVRRIAHVCASTVALIGLLTLAEYLFGWNLRIDQLLFKEPSGTVGTFSPGRMAPNTAFNFLILGFALMLLDAGTRGGHRPAQFLALTAAFVALLALLGYTYGVTSLYAIASYTRMAAHTALTFIILSLGVLFARPQHGLMAIITSESTGGVLARRLVPAAIGIPSVLGWLRLVGERAGLYDTAFGVSLFVVANLALITALIGATSRSLHRTDTERMRAEEALANERNLLRALIDNLPDFIFAKDTESRFVTNNIAHLRVVRATTPDEVVGKTDFDIFSRELAAQYYADERAVIQSGQPLIDREEPYIDETGNKRWLSTTKAPWRDGRGKIVGLVGASRDITERKRADEHIQQLNDKLKTQTAQLEAANKELEAFSYSVSHDLRAPLRAMSGFSQALLEEYADRVDETGGRYLQRIQDAAVRMGQLIDDLLNLSRVARTELRRERVDLSTLAQSVADELRQRDRQRLVEFVIANGITVEGDERLLRVVLENLLGNAWKFTLRRDRARVEFGVTQNAGETVYFVRDNGAGFDMAYADKLFGAFQRLHAADEFPGTGIGLATVQRIIHRHGGRVWAEGAVKNGATFYFTLGRGGG